MSVTMTKVLPAAPSWLKSGKEAHTIAQAEQAAKEVAMAASKMMRRFYMDVNEEKVVTFLDGVLDKDGILERFAFYEHTLQVGPRWDNFICVGGQEVCPICAGGNKPAFVAVFTVINHTPYTIKKGPNQGKVVKDQRQLYVAKHTTLQQLQHFASKRGGLAGWKVEISRLTDKEARVGSTFQFMGKTELSDLAKKYGEEGVAGDYMKELRYLPAAELIKLGLGKAPSGPGYEAGVTEDYSDSM